MLKKVSLLLFFSIFVFAVIGKAQECAPPAIVANSKSANLFSPEQEMILGELTLQRMSGDVRLVRDEKLQAYINSIGERLVKHLPPTGLKFQFHIMDIPDANAYNIPGGHIFLSRKLIGFVNNEAELVGVIAHELGHATVHHGATNISERLRKILNVTAVGDRKDIAEKYNLLIENARTKRVAQRGGHENEQQMEADKIGLFAMVAAGYDPNAFYAFFDRLTESEGKTGSWFSDLFGKTTPNQKRLREMTQATEQLPQSCRENRAAKTTEDFLRWQAEVVSFRNAGRKEELPGLIWKKELAPKLRSDVSRVDVSRDGKYLLVADDFSLTIIERDPLQVVFQIPVEAVDDAYITPDSQFVVFDTKSLRFEKWSIAEKKPVEVRELVLRRDCWENRLSPDGNYLACVDTSAALNVLDTRTGKRIWQKKDFYQLDYFEYLTWLFSDKNDDNIEKSLFRIEFAPDSRSVMFSRSENFRYRFRVDGMRVAGSENTVLALDLTTLKPIEIGGEIKNVSSRGYAFLDSQRILGMPANKAEDSGIFSFPSGKRLQKFTFFAKEIKTTGNPDYVIIKPLANSTMGIFDTKTLNLVAGMNKQDATVWNNTLIFESVSGKILIREIQNDAAGKNIDGKDVASIEIPVSAIGNLSAAQVSNNFNWLILSSKTRGGMWNVPTGERKILARGFRGGIVADDGGGIGEFPKMKEDPHVLALLNPLKQEVIPVRELPGKGAKQYGRFVLTRSSLKEQKTENKDGKKKDDKKTESSGPAFDDTDASLRENVRFELKNFIEDKVIWSRDFPKDSPRYSFDEYSGRIMFYWGLATEAGKAKLKESPELQAKADALGSKEGDYIIEVVDAFAGKTVGTLLLETGKGSFYVYSGLSEGDWLLLYDSQDRVLIYSIKTGELRHRFFGRHAAINPVRNQIAVENFPGEVSIYNLETGNRQANYVINGKAAFVRFNLEGNRLFVLSDAQAAYAFDLNKAANAAPRNLE